MKSTRILAVVAAVALLVTTAVPPASATKTEVSKKAAALQTTAREFSVSEDFVQGELNKGYRLSEVRAALDKKKAGKSYEAALKEAAPHPVAPDKRKFEDVAGAATVTDKEKKAARERYEKTAVTMGPAPALTDTPETTDEPQLETRFDQSPYLVPAASGTVSTVSGSVNVRETDIELPGRNGMSFPLTRTFSNDGAQPVEWVYADTYTNKKDNYELKMFQIGLGWAWEIPFIEFHGSRKYVNLPSGGKHMHVPEEQHGWYFSGYPWRDYVFQKLSDGTYSLFNMRSSITYSFSKTGKLTRMQDKFGNGFRLSYDATSSLLSKVENDWGQSIDIVYSDTSVTITSGGKSVVYSMGKLDLPDYPQQSVLKEVKDPEGRVTTYQYKSATAVSYRNTSDIHRSAPYALMTSILHPTKAVSNFVYGAEPQIRRPFSSYSEYYPVLEANNQIYYQDGTVRTLNRKQFEHYEGWYDQTLRTKVTDDIGRSHTYEYAQGNYVYTGWTTKQKSLTVKTDIVTVREDYTYDGWPTLPTTTTKRISLTADPTKYVTSRTTAAYDHYGNLVQAVDALGGTVAHKYGVANQQLIETTVYLQGAPFPTNATGKKYQQTTYIRDPINNAVTSKIIKDDTGKKLREESYGHDSFGNVTTKTVAVAEGKTYTTSFQYPDSYFNAYPAHVTSQVTDADGGTSSIAQGYQFDLQTGQMTQHSDGRGNATSFVYDNLDRVTKATYSDGSVATLEYNDENNQIIQSVVDSVKNLTLKKEVNKWNPLGWKEEAGIFDGDNYLKKSKFSYDSYGRMIEGEDALGNATRYQYDAFDRQKEITYADGAVQGYVYDDLNRTTVVNDADGYSTRATKDLLDRTVKTEMITAAGAEVLSAFTYDQVGNVLTKTDAKGNVTQYKYNAMSELTAVTDALGKTTGYLYDMKGNITGVTFPDTNTIQKQYNEFGKLVKQTNEKGQVKKYYYDENMNLIKQIDYKGQVQHFTFNSRNLLMEKSTDDDFVSYEYDAIGRRTKMVDSTGTTGYSYGVQGQLERVKLPDGRFTTFDYDANGNRMKMTDAFGKEVFYNADSRNRLNNIFLGSRLESAEVTYHYTKNNQGNLVDYETLRNGVVNDLSYDLLGRQESLVGKRSDGSVVNNDSYKFDKNNNIVSRGGNNEIHNFDYDALDRVTSSSQLNESYEYDERGNRKTMQSDRELEVDSIASEKNYVYNGWNRLISATTKSGEIVEYTYNGDGFLYERKSMGETIRYYYDGEKVIAEAIVIDGNVTLKARYVRGKSLIAKEDSKGQKAYYQHNLHGDVVALTDGTGKILNRYEYSIWGEPLTSEEQIENSFRYSGELWDDDTELLYLRARWYDPTIGRFINEDTYEGEVEDPLSLNLYSYVHNNPLRYVDPTGHWKDGDEKLLPVIQELILELTNDYDEANYDWQRKLYGVIADFSRENQASVACYIVGQCDFGKKDGRVKKYIEELDGLFSDDFSEWLNVGKKDTEVYFMMRADTEGNHHVIYVGITKNINKRASQHKRRGKIFLYLDSISEKLTRNQARAIEQALINHYGHAYINERNSISPQSPFYEGAVKWGENWLRNNGHLK